MPETIAITVNILGKDYRVACLPQERDGLLASAKFLNERMSKIRDSGKIIGTERVAVMAALNLAHEFLQLHLGEHQRSEVVRNKVSELRQRVESALESNSQLQV
ncbi:MAG: cell division protein ZapA [Gammaproteobacteria bacterium]|nr:cell division protein ZapA [Gammaproteobacteria bacterium]MDH5693571.1 cell division protein ZapA [Gammaproteobacteria bacterium]